MSVAAPFPRWYRTRMPRDKHGAGRRLRNVCIVWTLAFVACSILLGYGIVAQDWRFVRYGFLGSLFVHPASAVAAYLETRAAWSGEDTETKEATIILCLLVAVIGVSYLL